MKVNRAEFFKEYRKLFNPELTKQQVAGYDAIFDYWESSPLNDLRWLSYALATAYHETGGKIEPVREGFAKTNEEAIRAVTKLFEKKKILRNYALPHPNGNSYYGRGLPQITHGFNYEKIGKAIEVPLYENPDLALRLDIAVKLMFVSMTDGLFTGKRFRDYFSDTKTDWQGARRIINGTDKKELIADYAKKFFSCLS